MTKNKLNRELESKTLSFLRKLAKKLGIKIKANERKGDLIQKILNRRSKSIRRSLKAIYSSQRSVKKRSRIKINFQQIKTALSQFFYKKISRAFYILFIITLFFIGIWSFVDFNKLGRINSELVLDGNCHFSYSTGQMPTESEDRISPLCGCMVVRPHRGVEFFSKQFNLKVKNNQEIDLDTFPFKQFLIVGPYHYMDPLPYFYVGADYYLIRGNFFSEETLKKLANGDKSFLEQTDFFTKKPTIINHKRLEKAELVALINDTGELDVYLLGDYPISALLPMQNSKISINKFLSQYQRKWVSYNISEKFDYKFHEPGENHPMLDVLGSRIALVSKPGIFLAPKEKVYINDLEAEKEYSTNVLSVLILNVGYSARISMSPSNMFMINTMKEKFTPIIVDAQSGEIEINVNSPLLDEEFIKLKSRVEENVIFKENYPEGINGMGSLEMGLPHMPSETNGIYFYGPVKELVSTEAKGKIQFRNETHVIDPSRKVEFFNMKDMFLFAEPIILTMNYNGQLDAITKFKADGNMKIDDFEITNSFFDQKTFQIASRILPVIAGLIALLKLMLDLKVSRKDENNV